MSYILCANGKTKHRNAATAKRCRDCAAAARAGRGSTQGRAAPNKLLVSRFDVPGGGSGMCNSGAVGGGEYLRDTDGEGHVGVTDLVVKNSPIIRSRGEGTMHLSMSEVDGGSITCMGDPESLANYCSVNDSLVRGNLTLHNASLSDSRVEKGDEEENQKITMYYSQAKSTTFAGQGSKELSQVRTADSQIKSNGAVTISATDQFDDGDFLDEEDWGKLEDTSVYGTGDVRLGKASGVLSSIVHLGRGGELHTGNGITVAHSDLRIPDGQKAYITKPRPEVNEIMEAAVVGTGSDGVAIVGHRANSGDTLHDSWGNVYRDDGMVYLQERGTVHAFAPMEDGTCSYRYSRGGFDDIAEADPDVRLRYERMAGDYARQTRYDRTGSGGCR